MEEDASRPPDQPPALRKVETQNERNKRLAREAKEAEEARLAELKKAEEAARREELERLRIEQEKTDRLDRRAARVEVSLRKFVVNHSKLLDSMKIVLGQKKEKAPKPKKAKKEAAGKKKKQPSPVQQSWIEMLTEIDTKINERKLCGLDDIMGGFEKLNDDEQRALIGIIEAIKKKDLPKGKELKDTHSIIHKTLVMAASANSYRRQKVPVLHVKTTATDLRKQGFSVREIHEQGYGAHALRSAKCPIDEIVDAVDNLEDLFLNQVKVSDLAAVNSVKHQIGGYRGAMKLRGAGYSANSIRQANTHSAWELRTAGFELNEMKGAGFLAPNLREAGFGDKSKQPAGEGLTAVIAHSPMSYGYEEDQRRLSGLREKLMAGASIRDV